MGNPPSSYQQNEKSYKMFPGNKTALGVRSNSLEATPRKLLLTISTRIKVFFPPLLLDFSLKCFENNSTSVAAVLLDRSALVSVSICTDKVRDSCLSDRTFQVFHLQFACRAAKLILTHFRVDPSPLNCTHCLFAFSIWRQCRERRRRRARGTNIQAGTLIRRCHCSFRGVQTNKITTFSCLHRQKQTDRQIER